MDSYFREFLADIPDSGLGEDRICDVFVQRVYDDPTKATSFKWAVSIMRFKGNDLEEAKTLATFVNYKLALDFGKKVKEAFEKKGYETYLKGEVGE
ncbi:MULTISPECIES: hypothetical protein [unclassified Desulfurobacterium]|uniref:hypothetical protein n=1 Tax=unclassified Desulfurobacterium TaxID=2639089 RepID=UPI0003B490AB|nr:MULTISPECIES: hypothetical protein [unclassified Desulfurobacterium]